MESNTSIIEWAAKHASTLISPLGNRWLHTQGVVERAQQVGGAFDEAGCALLIAAANVHDIGYAPGLQVTGFHPLDGAYYLLLHNQKRLASLVAYHSEAQCEAQLRGLATQLNNIPREHSALADALTYCDMITGPTGLHISFEERLEDIFQRYEESTIVNQAIHQAIPSLLRAVKRTQNSLLQEEILSACWLVFLARTII